jgi:hypothetical protein
LRHAKQNAHDRDRFIVATSSLQVQERHTRIKHDAGSVDALTQLALADAGLSFDDVDSPSLLLTSHTTTATLLCTSQR